MQKFDPFAVSLGGMHLVEASAGTGKTYNITSLFIRALVEERADVREILVLTYTNAATDELKERVLGRLRESLSVLKSGIASDEDEFLGQLLEKVKERERAVATVENALRNFDEASIFTIHGFCQRALLEQSFLGGVSFGGELLADDSEFIQDIVEDQWRKLVEVAEEDLLERVWLTILREEGYLPDALAGVVRTGIGKPYLHLTPDISGISDRRADLEELLRLFKELKTIWPGEQDKIKEMLLSDVMNGQRYRHSWVQQWAEEMGRWLEGKLPVLSPFDKFDRFSFSFIQESGVKKGKDAPDDPFFRAVDAYIARVENLRMHISGFKIKLFEETGQAVMDKKIATGVLGYDDLLIFLNNALKRSPGGGSLAEYLRSRFPVAMVDEFQDTDPVQYQILTSIYGEAGDRSALFLIGDPKQSIYSFRGADVFSYIKARSNVPKGNKYGLDRNFRSRQELIQGINKLFGRLDRPFLVEEIAFNPGTSGRADIEALTLNGARPPAIRFLCSSSMSPDVQLTKSDCGNRAAEVTAESITRLLSGGMTGAAGIGDRPVTAKDIAVLVRTHKQAELIKDALARRNVKSVQYSQKSVFNTKEANDMISLLKAMGEPGNESSIRVVLASDLFSYTAADLVELQENEQGWLDLTGLFGELNKIWNEHGFAKAFKTFLRRSQVEKEIILSENGERKLTNFLQLGELLQTHERDRSPGPHELIRWLVQKRHDPDENSDEEQLRLESDVELVKIVTLHRSKGLEYPITYCPFLWYGSTLDNTRKPFIYHNPENDYYPCLDFGEKGGPGRDLHRYWAALEEVSENLRLAYVALTRAKQQCTIVYEPSSGIEYSSLGYLLLGYEPVADHLKDKILSEGSTGSVPVDLFFTALEQLTDEESSLFGLEQLDEQELTKIMENGESGAPHKPNRIFSQYAATRSRKYISSFSSIMHPVHSTTADQEFENDEFFLPEVPGSTPDDSRRSIFSFPKGPKAGTCVHSIFEDLPFNGDPDQTESVKKNLNRFGFESGWTDVIDRMVSSVLDCDLNSGIRLSDIKQDDMVKEMEFHFDLHSHLRDDIIRTIRGETRGNDSGVSVPGGFMKGYIDLVFRHRERYFIADYKTNHLGYLPEDYSVEKMQEQIVMAGYDVQYHIYLLALHRFLQGRIKHYSFDDHVGGVFYLFVRGMTQGGTQEGVFFDRPNLATIERLDKLFREGGGE